MADMALLNPNLGLVFWMVLVFGLLLLLLRKFAWKPILQAIRNREDKIEEALHLAEKTQSEMEQLKFDNQKLFQEAKEERDRLLLEARAIKDTIINDAKLKAEEEYDRIITSAKESIHYEKMAAITELKNQMAKISIEIAEKVLAQELAEPGRHKDLIEREMVNLQF